MHRALLPFEFAEPTSVAEAVHMVDGQKARILAGGVDLVLKMRLRQILPEKVVSLQKMPGLGYVSQDDSGLRIGCLVTLHQLEHAPEVRDTWPLLSEAIGSIVSVQAKVMGTAVGNLCVGTPASDLAPALYALGARVTIAGTDVQRELPVEEFFLGPGLTAVGEHELVTEVSIPNPPAASSGVFAKLSKTSEDIAKVNTAVSVWMADGVCAGARIALGSVAPTPIRAAEAERLLVGQPPNAKTILESAEAAMEAALPISDVRSTAAYRREMVRVIVNDALERAFTRISAVGGRE